MAVTNGGHLLVGFDGFENLHEFACSATSRYELLHKHPFASQSCSFAMLSWAPDLAFFVAFIGIKSLNFFER